LGSTRTVDVRPLAGADARIAIAARAAPRTAADRNGLAPFAHVGDLLAEVGAWATLAHVTFALAVRALAAEQVGHRLPLLFLQRDVRLLIAAFVIVGRLLRRRVGLLLRRLRRARRRVGALLGLLL